MGKRTQFRKRARRVRARRNKRFRRGKSLIPVFAPQKLAIKVKYHQDDILNPGAAGIPDASIYHVNSPYDPWAEAGGNQPMGFDQWMTTGEGTSTGIFRRFTVIGSRIKVTFQNRDASNNQRVGICVKELTTVPTDSQEYTEAKRGKTMILGKYGSGNDIATMSYNFSPKKYWKCKNLLDGQLYAGTASSNPTRLAYFHVWSDGIGTDTGQVYVSVNVEYIVVLTEPVDRAES